MRVFAHDAQETIICDVLYAGDLVEHVSELDLIELVAGHLAGAARQSCEAHLAACAGCRERRREIEHLWTQLGSFQAPWPVLQPADAVREAIEHAPASVPWRIPVPRLIRVAAAVAIAAGAGHLAGRLTWKEAQSTPASAATESLYLNEVFGNGAGRMAETMAHESRAAAREEMSG